MKNESNAGLRLTMVMALMERDLPAEKLIEEAEILVNYISPEGEGTDATVTQLHTVQ